MRLTISPTSLNGESSSSFKAPLAQQKHQQHHQQEQQLQHMQQMQSTMHQIQLQAPMTGMQAMQLNNPNFYNNKYFNYPQNSSYPSHYYSSTGIT